MLGAYDIRKTINSLSFKVKGCKKTNSIEIVFEYENSYTMIFSDWRGYTISKREIANVHKDIINKKIQDVTGIKISS